MGAKDFMKLFLDSGRRGQCIALHIVLPYTNKYEVSQLRQTVHNNTYRVMPTRGVGVDP
jgi:hypothetical protein